MDGIVLNTCNPFPSLNDKRQYSLVKKNFKLNALYFYIDYNHNLLTDGTPDIKSVDITPCTAQPCKFHHGMNVTVSVTFIAG